MNLFRMPWKLRQDRPLVAKPPADVIICRYEKTDQGTFGLLRGPKGFECHVCELPDRDNASNISRIPAGEYACVIRKSPRFGVTYHVTDVKCRSYILMHPGNIAGDKSKGWRTHSAGCLLLGKYRGKLHGQKAVMVSRPVIRSFMNLMGEKPFKLSIVNKEV